MILIADSGSTKTDWCIIHEKGVYQRVKTQGINPFFQGEEEIVKNLQEDLLPQLKSIVFDSVYFYGAGCVPEKAEIVVRSIRQTLRVADNVSIYTDILAAAHALCGMQPGIACILGTGSNSCLYDGEKIIQNISPLGFILGDEGSGAYLGKILVGDLLKDQLGESLKQAFFRQFPLSPAEIIDKVYRQPFPNRFLASLSPFIKEHIEDIHIRDLVRKAFTAFFTRNVMQYPYKTIPVHFVGSIAYYYERELKECACELGIKIGVIMQSPMDGLIRFYEK